MSQPELRHFVALTGRVKKKDLEKKFDEAEKEFQEEKQKEDDAIFEQIGDVLQEPEYEEEEKRQRKVDLTPGTKKRKKQEMKLEMVEEEEEEEVPETPRRGIPPERGRHRRSTPVPPGTPRYLTRSVMDPRMERRMRRRNYGGKAPRSVFGDRMSDMGPELVEEEPRRSYGGKTPRSIFGDRMDDIKHGEPGEEEDGQGDEGEEDEGDVEVEESGVEEKNEEEDITPALLEDQGFRGVGNADEREYTMSHFMRFIGNSSGKAAENLGRWHEEMEEKHQDPDEILDRLEGTVGQMIIQEFDPSVPPRTGLRAFWRSNSETYRPTLDLFGAARDYIALSPDMKKKYIQQSKVMASKHVIRID